MPWSWVSFSGESVAMIFPSSIMKKIKAAQVKSVSTLEGNEKGIAWFCIEEIIEKKTKNGKTYWIVEVIDSTSSLTKIKCWGVRPERAMSHINRPYLAKLDFDPPWGFSTRSIRHNFRLLG